MTLDSLQIRATVVAIGGNALADGVGGPAESARRAAFEIAELSALGLPLAITHGNGPQVGRALMRAAAAEPDQAPLPMDIAVAHTQGEVGQLLVGAIESAIEALERLRDSYEPGDPHRSREAHRSRDTQGSRRAPSEQGLSAPSRPVVSLVTRTLVAPDDPAFGAPDKPIGPWMGEVQALRLARLRAWSVKSIGERGWRRVVASPEPLAILEAGVISALVVRGTIVICVGGGGIPVVRTDHEFKGVEAVVDKDLASALLADAIDAGRLVIATDVPGVAIDHGGENERWLERVSAEEARSLLNAGHFPAGSMGPKVRAALRFVEGGKGRVAAITSLDRIREACEGRAGTLFFSASDDSSAD